MSVIEIRSGLRRLEFSKDDTAPDPSASFVIVEFVRPEPLRAGQVARIELGLHEGSLRELVGKPKLLKKSTGEAAEYHYRLQGTVA